MVEAEGPGRVVGACLAFFATVEAPTVALARVLVAAVVVVVVAAARLRVAVALTGGR